MADQAVVIIEAVDNLPDDLVDPATRRRAEAHLVGLAADHHAEDLRRLGRHLLEVAAPEAAEEWLARQLDAEEARAREAARLTMPLETLLGGHKPATLDTGAEISGALARRFACEAGIIPAVLGGRSQVLDLGRESRFHNKAQRITLALEQGGCTTDGCDWPPGMCHAHHDTPWHVGGHTNTATGRLLCPRHHAWAHDPAYTMTKLPGDKVSFTHRT